jgi:hypothetical protein
MSGGDVLRAGIAADHVPALVAGVLFCLAVGLGTVAGRRPLARRFARTPRPAAEVLPDAVAAWLLGLSAVIHAALPLGHHDDVVLAVAFVAGAVAYGVFALRVLRARPWRRQAAVLVVLTLLGYLVVLASGGEQPDQVGLLTGLAELLILGICLAPRAGAGRLTAAASAAGLLTAVVVFGGASFVLSIAAHDPGGSRAASEAGSEGHDGHDGQAEAGTIEAPHDDRAATPREVAAAADLAARTRRSLTRFRNIRAALAAGYRTQLARTGYDLHLERADYSGDDDVLDPDRPEVLMYAVADGRASLLSAVYTMPRAGTAGPTPGGPIMHWHAHNVCGTLLPPGIGIVDALGGCPPLSVHGTSVEMMHVWVVDPPGGAFTEHVDQAWLAEYNRAHGIPFSW